jgi:hypothetical protein
LVIGAALLQPARLINQKFFASFFKKEGLPYLKQPFGRRSPFAPQPKT